MTTIRRAAAIILFLAFGLALGAGLRLDARRGPVQAQPAAASQAVAIQNGSFEEMDGAIPRDWRRTQFQRGATFAVDTIAHTGRASARISSTDGADAAWAQVVPVRPYARYRLSGWIKTENLEQGSSRGALLNIHGLDGVETSAVSGTRDWTHVELEFDSGGNDAVQVNCLFGGWGRARGAAWYDDVQIEQWSARELKPAVTIAAAKSRAPMSKYIYGQFIEHLGRCIYGGIWAEMLEDRKFFYAVGDKNSPWKPWGDPAAVTMGTEAPFVGAHTPEIKSAGAGPQLGIVQGELALTKGQRYVGRVVLAGEAPDGAVRVRLLWGEGESGGQTVVAPALGSNFRTVALSFVSGETTDAGRLAVLVAGRARVRVGAVSLMPADNVEGFRPDTLRLLRELDAPVYRWPGGNFVSGYDWRDGLGDRDKRPPRKNPAWLGVEHNDVGIDEFMALCRLIGAEPYIAVNSGLGDVKAAADEVEYVNGAPATPMGRQRERNGHRAPYACRFWSIGNEMYGDWQLGHMPLEAYQQKHNEFAAAMRQRDPTIRLIGVGAVGDWSEGMLRNCAASMDLISEHFYCQERQGLLSHVSQIPNQIRRIAEAHRKYRQTIPSLAGRDIRIALDEWNYWYGPHVYGELGTQYFLKDALGIAAGIHEYSRQSDIVFMANYAQTVNVIGAIKTSKRDATLDTTGVVLKLYRQRFGTIPVEVTGATEPLDVAAAWRENGRGLTVSVVNPTRSAQVLEIELTGAALPTAARLWRIEGTDERARNEPGKPPQVTAVETPSAPFSRRVTVPPMSVSLFELGLTK
jgi:alpha-L-arabinofuranosidase